MHSRDYHLFLFDTAGRQLGHLLGPIPQIGFIIETEVEDGQTRDLLVAKVKLHGGNITNVDAPTVTTVTVICQVQTDQPAIPYAAIELDEPTYIRRGVAALNERTIGAHANN